MNHQRNSLKISLSKIFLPLSAFFLCLIAGSIAGQDAVIHWSSGVKHKLGTFEVGAGGAVTFWIDHEDHSSVQEVRILSESNNKYREGELFNAVISGAGNFTFTWILFGTYGFTLSYKETKFSGAIRFVPTECQSNEIETRGPTMFNDRVCEPMSKVSITFLLDFDQAASTPAKQDKLVSQLLDQLSALNVNVTMLTEISVHKGSVIFVLWGPLSIIDQIKAVIPYLSVYFRGALYESQWDESLASNDKTKGKQGISAYIYAGIALGSIIGVLALVLLVLWINKRSSLPDAKSIIDEKTPKREKQDIKWQRLQSESYNPNKIHPALAEMDVFTPPPSNKPPREWTFVECLGWLKKKKLDYMVSRFEKARLSGGELLLIRRDDPILHGLPRHQVDHFFAMLDELWRLPASPPFLEAKLSSDNFIVFQDPFSPSLPREAGPLSVFSSQPRKTRHNSLSKGPSLGLSPADSVKLNLSVVSQANYFNDSNNNITFHETSGISET